LETLRQTRVVLGNPTDKLVHLTCDLFTALHVQLDAVQESQLQAFDYYYLTLPVTFKPGNGAQLSRITCQIDFGPHGPNEPIVQNLFPRSEWKEVLQYGGALKLGLSGGLNWQAEMEIPATLNMATLPGSVSANIVQKNELKSFIAIPDYTYSLGRSEIAAAGIGNNFAWWDLIDPKLVKVQDVSFGVVFKVPHGILTISLEALAQVEPSYPWLVAQLGHLFAALDQKWVDLLKRTPEERKESERLARTDREAWELVLPK
jgi:hypothetical protein